MLQSKTGETYDSLMMITSGEEFETNRNYLRILCVRPKNNIKEAMV